MCIYLIINEFITICLAYLAIREPMNLSCAIALVMDHNFLEPHFLEESSCYSKNPFPCLSTFIPFILPYHINRISIPFIDFSLLFLKFVFHMYHCVFTEFRNKFYYCFLLFKYWIFISDDFFSFKFFFIFVCHLSLHLHKFRSKFYYFFQLFKHFKFSFRTNKFSWFFFQLIFLYIRPSHILLRLYKCLN